jgi:hypothetical protein
MIRFHFGPSWRLWERTCNVDYRGLREVLRTARSHLQERVKFSLRISDDINLFVESGERIVLKIWKQGKNMAFSAAGGCCALTRV